MDEELKKEFEDVVEKYTDVFCEKMYGLPRDLDDYWIQDDIGGIVSIGDEFWGFDQIRKTVDNDYDPKQVFAWYDYCVRLGSIDHTIPVPNLESWMNGCPRYSEEQISNIEEQSRILQNSINNLKGSIPGKEQKCER